MDEMGKTIGAYGAKLESLEKNITKLLEQSEKQIEFQAKLPYFIVKKQKTITKRTVDKEMAKVKEHIESCPRIKEENFKALQAGMNLKNQPTRFDNLDWSLHQKIFAFIFVLATTVGGVIWEYQNRANAARVQVVSQPASQRTPLASVPLRID